MFYFSAIILGLALGAMCIGLFISLRIFNFPDITTDGSYTLGAVVTAVGLVADWPLILILLMVLFSGALSGVVTGLLHTRMRLNSLLSGILVMTGLYSVNLFILGRSNVPIPRESKTIFTLFQGVSSDLLVQGVVIFLIVIGIAIIITRLLKTDFGLGMRATGNNSIMARSVGIDADTYKTIGLALANGLVAMSGFLVVQVQGFADINMGIGIVILGLGAVMIGESLSNLFHIKSLFGRVIGVVLGSILFRLILSVALTLGVDPIWLKLITAGIVVLLVGLPNLLPGVRRRTFLD